MRYIILGFFALLIYLLTFVLLPAEEDLKGIFEILYFDLIFVIATIICWQYWGNKEVSKLLVRILVIQIGMGMIILGGYLSFTGDYILTSISHRSALVVELNNFLGGYFHPLIPGAIWFCLGGYIARYGIKGW